MQEKIKNRTSLRLPDYDYSFPAAYFITICAQNRDCLFGNVLTGKMSLNESGEMIKKWWLKIENKFMAIILDEFVIMPNHFHGILQIVDDERARGAPTVGNIIGWFKTMTTNEYIRCVKNKNWMPFVKRLWQRNYYEHIIRNDESLYQLREYIVNNPLKWELDELNPEWAAPQNVIGKKR